MQAHLCSPTPLMYSLVGQSWYIRTLLAAGGSHMVPISRYIHPPLVLAKQAYTPWVWSFSIHFGKLFGKYPCQCHRQRAPDNPLIRSQLGVVWLWSWSLWNLSAYLLVVVSTGSHDSIWWLSVAMPFGDCHSQCRSVDYLVCSEIMFGLVWDCCGRHNCTRSA